MNTETSFIGDGDRYRFDTGRCSIARGFAQLDTSQDAWYYGIWASPRRLEVVSYAEGDLSVTKCETVEEFAAGGSEDLRARDSLGFRGIDPGARRGARRGVPGRGAR